MSVLFKAEASAWTPAAVQIQQVWVDPHAGRGYGARGMRDLCRLLLDATPFVTLFVRTENAPAIALYESIGMRPRRPLPLAALLSAHGDPRAPRRERVQRPRRPERRPRVPGGAHAARSRAGAGARRRAPRAPIDLFVTSEFERASPDRRRGTRGPGPAAARGAGAERPAATAPSRASCSTTTAAGPPARRPRAVPGARRREPLRDRRALRRAPSASCSTGRRRRSWSSAIRCPSRTRSAAREGARPERAFRSAEYATPYRVHARASSSARASVLEAGSPTPTW